MVAPTLQKTTTVFGFCTVNTANQSYTSYHGTPSTPPYLSLGLNDAPGCASGLSGAGVNWNWEVALPSLGGGHLGSGSGAGTIGMVQLITKSSTCGNVPGRVVDQASFYDYRGVSKPGYPTVEPFVDAEAGETAEWIDSDSPHLALHFPHKTYHESFKAWDYVMYRSAVEGSDWIPIGELIWSWEGTARFSLGSAKWRLVNGSATNPTAANASFYAGIIAPLPQWSTAHQEGAHSFC